MLIGICGKLGSGKDYFATHALKRIIDNAVHINFADQIKMNTIVKNNVSFNSVVHNKTQATRILLQHEGTENGRDRYGQDVWIKYYDNWVKLFQSRGIENIVCTDIRFPNEFEYFKKRGGFIIKIVSPELNHRRLMIESCGDHGVYNKISSHISECSLDHIPDSDYNLVVHNDKNKSVEELTKLFKEAFYLTI